LVWGESEARYKQIVADLMEDLWPRPSRTRSEWIEYWKFGTDRFVLSSSCNQSFNF